MPMLKKALLATCLSLACAGALALDLRFERVAEGVHAYIGETGARTADNEGLNANIGLVATPAGAVLVDSGATWQGARQIHDAVKAVTPQPVKWVFNTGGQDHRWLGNGYFAAQGAELIAHAGGRADMDKRGNHHLQGLKATLGAKADGTVPTLPTRWLDTFDVIEQLNPRLLVPGNASRTYLEVERE